MKTALFALVISMFVAPSEFAFAREGGDRGNGGGAIVCVQPNGDRTVRLLDLAEAEKSGALSIVRSQTPWPVQLEAALKKYGSVHADLTEMIRKELDYMSSNTLPADRRLPPPADTDITELNEPENCFLEGVANYDDRTVKLEIRTELESLMSETDKAALRFHEAWYRVQRSKISKTDNSKVARQVTASVFASEPLVIESPLRGIETSKARCVSEDQKYVFDVLPASRGHELLFSRIGGIVSGERMAVVVSSHESRPGLRIDGDFEPTLKEGFVAKARPLTKEEKNRSGMGTERLGSRNMTAKLTTKYGAPFVVHIASTDWATNEGLEKLNRVSRNGFESGRAWSWSLKKPTAYENYSNFIAHVTPDVRSLDGASYSKTYNSKFTCKAR